MTTTSSLRLRGALLTAGAAACWSLGGIIVRLVECGPWEIIFWRSAYMALTLCGYLSIRHRRDVVREFLAIGAVGTVVALLYATAFVLFVASIARTSVANTLVIMAAAPLVSALLAWPILGERVSARTAATIAVAIGGIALMFSDALGGGVRAGDLLAVALALAVGATTVALRRARNLNMVPAVCVAGVLAALVSWPVGRPFEVSLDDLALLALMGTAQLALPLVLFVHGVRYLPAAEVGLLTLLETVLAPIWVWIGVAEAPSTMALAGGGIVVGALAFHSARGARRSKPPIGMA